MKGRVGDEMQSGGESGNRIEVGIIIVMSEFMLYGTVDDLLLLCTPTLIALHININSTWWLPCNIFIDSSLWRAVVVI